MANYLELARHALERVSMAPIPAAPEIADGSAEPLEAVLKGHAVELWSDALGQRLWIVADEEDAAMLGEPRGSIYTVPEVRRIISIRDRAIVAEIHAWKKQFGGKLRE